MTGVLSYNMNLILFFLYLLALFAIWSYFLGGPALSAAGVGVVLLILLGVWVRDQWLRKSKNS